MNKFLPVLAGSLLLIPPILIDAPSSQKLAGASQDMLEQGWEAIAVCTIIDGYGIKRFTEFYNATKDESTSSDSVAGKSIAVAGALYDNFKLETTLGENITKVLKDKYHMSDKDVAALFNDLLDATATGLKDKYDPVDNYDDFVKVYMAPVSSCLNVLKSFVNKLKTMGSSKSAI